MQLAIGGKGSNITQIENLYINAHIDLEEIRPLIRQVLDELEQEQPEKGLSNLSVACLRLAEKVKGEYVRPALLIAAQNANLIPESALVAMSVHEMLCEMVFEGSLSLEEYVCMFAIRMEKLLHYENLPEGLDWMDNLYMNRMLYYYDGAFKQNIPMNEMLKRIVLKNYFDGSNAANLQQIWNSHAVLSTITGWHDRIPRPFGLTLAGVALARVYIEYKGINASGIERF